MKQRKFLALFLAVFPLFSCATRIDGFIVENGNSKLDVSTALKPGITSLVRRLAAAGGQQSALILDGPAIAESLSASSLGNVSASFKNSSPTAIEGNLNIKNINRFLFSIYGDVDAERFVVFEQGKSGGKFKFFIDFDNGPEFLERLSPEIAAYLSVIMAPIATGEEMTKTEYLALVSSIFSKAISEEIATSRIRVSITFPGQVTSAAGGTFKGKTADFDISLLDILVLETPVTYEVIWK